MESSSSLKGFELGNLVLSSGLLQNSWSKISRIHKAPHLNKDSGLVIKIYPEAKFTLVVFGAPPIRRNSYDLTPLSGSEYERNPFHFLCSEKVSKFYVHTPSYELFDSAFYKDLPELKSKLLKSEKPVIITGAALGGSVASLFTLWLLETIDPKLKRPLCITFGSPLIGDAFLQQILENSLWNSCFLHVAEAANTPIKANSFKPFGTFLICFYSECICIEDPEAVMELLLSVDTDDLVGWRDYGEILQRLDQSSMTDSGLMIDDTIDRMEERVRKKLRFDPLKKLNDMKISLMYIEWYKKKSKINKIGYYDRFKARVVSPLQVDVDLQKRKKELNDFWKSMVEEFEKMPQSEKSILKTRCLFAGNNYRRMIEPLDIAEYYINGHKDYRTSGRFPHYVMLEKWFKAESIKPDRCKNRDLSDLLTFDSCFWAEVEESLIVINRLKTNVGISSDEKEVLTGKLARFEAYVWGMIGKREVSPEIFLEESSFMKWWKEYKGFNPPTSHFTEYMDNWKYEAYGRYNNGSS